MKHEFRNVAIPFLLVLGTAGLSSVVYHNQVDASTAVVELQTNTIEAQKRKLEAMFVVTRATTTMATEPAIALVTSSRAVAEANVKIVTTPIPSKPVSKSPVATQVVTKNPAAESVAQATTTKVAEIAAADMARQQAAEQASQAEAVRQAELEAAQAQVLAQAQAAADAAAVSTAAQKRQVRTSRAS
jgi:hypothetical protein